MTPHPSSPSSSSTLRSWRRIPVTQRPPRMLLVGCARSPTRSIVTSTTLWQHWLRGGQHSPTVRRIELPRLRAKRSTSLAHPIAAAFALVRSTCSADHWSRRTSCLHERRSRKRRRPFAPVTPRGASTACEYTNEASTFAEVQSFPERISVRASGKSRVLQSTVSPHARSASSCSSAGGRSKRTWRASTPSWASARRSSWSGARRNSH